MCPIKVYCSRFAGVGHMADPQLVCAQIISAETISASHFGPELKHRSVK